MHCHYFGIAGVIQAFLRLRFFSAVVCYQRDEEDANEATEEGRQGTGRLLTVEAVASLLHLPVSWV